MANGNKQGDGNIDIRTVDLHTIRPLLGVGKGESCVLSTCSGGWVRKSDPTSLDGKSSNPCFCYLLREFQGKLGDLLWYHESRVESPLRYLHDKNVWIRGGQEEILTHLRDGLLHHRKFLYLRLRQSTDTEILAAEFRNDDDEEKDPLALCIENIFYDPEFLVVYLGDHSRRHASLSGILLDNLRLRKFRGLKTWVVTRPNWSQTPSWSKHLESFLTLDYQEQLDLGQSVDRETQEQAAEWLNKANKANKGKKGSS